MAKRAECPLPFPNRAVRQRELLYKRTAQRKKEKNVAHPYVVIVAKRTEEWRSSPAEPSRRTALCKSQANSPQLV